MRILFYNHTGQASGAERLLAMILARLDRERFEATMVCPEHGTLAPMISRLGVPLETVDGLQARFTWRVDRLAAYSWSFLQVMRELRRKVSLLAPELIHANSIRAGLVATAATIGMGTRVVWHLHDLLPRHPLSVAIRVFAGLSKRSRMIAVSDAVAQNFCGHLSFLLKSRVHVILNAIDLDRFQPEETVRQEIREELNLNDDNFVLGIIGQITPRKGQRELIAALKRSEVPRAVLLIVGAPLFNRDSEYALSLEDDAKVLGVADQVRMVGPRSDIEAIMQALDLLVVNSSAEPFGLVILEAMACGTPVLATAVDGIPEIIQQGTNGWLVAPHDVKALAEAIAYLSRESKLLALLAINGKQHAAANFSVERYIAELELFYLDTVLAAADRSRAKVHPDTVTREADSAKFA